MFDYEGSRGEFLKLLAECGEQPAFIARAQAPVLALDALISTCEAKRTEMLKWPAFHLSALAQHLRNDWSRLDCLLASSESVGILKALHANIQMKTPVGTNWLVSDKSALRQFLDSAQRYNRNWSSYIDGLDLELVNKPRRDFNQFYVLEKECAFGSERVADGFEPLGMIDSGFLYSRFPLLPLPKLTQ
jgi:hypothetical protein